MDLISLNKEQESIRGEQINCGLPLFFLTYDNNERVEDI